MLRLSLTIALALGSASAALATGRPTPLAPPPLAPPPLAPPTLPAAESNHVLDKSAVLARHSFLDNRDERWYAANVAFLETPDPTIDAAWFYRFDLITKHIVYGAPEHGYAVTEFIDRPGWSGTYGAISAPLGLQFADLRWLRDQRVTRDYARYWMHVPGAQPRAYTNWFGDAMWGLYEAWGDKAFIVAMLPDMKAQYAGWEAEHWDKRYQMFVWDGMHDGMETNINSRQTKDWFAGAPGVRPTFSSYMYADARAISNAASLAGDAPTAHAFAAKAAHLKAGVQKLLWDAKRQYFFAMFANDEPLADNAPGKIARGSLTYQSGPHAGSLYGRELIGLVPWQFHLPDAGYEAAWQGVMDPQVFFAPFGPTTTERHDPLFRTSDRCCEWSGNSWPFATAQTLEAMANLIQDYPQTVVSRDDYVRLLKVFTTTQRKDDVPFVAESANPDTGKWQIVPGHSEHYFHSSYPDLIVTGLAGLRPRADDRLVVNPLIPRDWRYFALDDLAYHGHLVSIVWDSDGTRYHRGTGLTLIVDGARVANRPTLGKLDVALPPARGPLAPPPSDAVNFAVNNAGSFFPRFAASYGSPDTPLQILNDGAHWYLKAPGNRWTTEGGSAAPVTLDVDFGIARPVDRIELYFLDDGAGSPVRAPAAVAVEAWTGSGWSRVTPTTIPTAFAGHEPSTIGFASPISARKFRLILTAQPGAALGLSEVELWGKARLPLAAPTAKIDDLAYNATGTGFPKASASYTSQYDAVAEVNDGKVFFSANSRNRWTAYESPNPVDWVEIDMGARKTVGRIEAYYWGENGSGEVRAPKQAVPQYWDGTAWQPFRIVTTSLPVPRASAVQTFTVAPVSASKVRLMMTHDGKARSGLTELMLWEK